MPAESAIPFDQIREAALAQAQRLLREWFPRGRKIGGEFKVGNLRGDSGDSLSINLTTGMWADFGRDPASGYDLIDLRAAMNHRGDRVAAARELGEKLGIRKLNGRAQASSSDDWQPIIPPPEGTPQPPDRMLAGYDVIYDYRDANDRLLQYVGRIEAQGDENKKFHPIVYGLLNGKRGWHKRHPLAPKPLYGLNRLAMMPDAPVLICEGEKSADAAQILFPRYACISWQGGAGSVEIADLAPLQGCDNVLIWPDNDVSGLEAGRKLIRMLPHARMLRVDDMRGGGDAADLQVDDPERWLREHLPQDSGDQTSDDRSLSRLRVLSPSDCETSRPRPYVVKGIIGRGDFGLIVGPPGAGKSVLGPHLGYGVAQDRPVFGGRVRQNSVLYIGAEDGHGLQVRVRALRQRWGEAPNFRLIPDAVDFRDPNGPDLPEVKLIIRQLEPALIIIDTLARAFPGLKENDPDEMARVVQVARELTNVCDSAVLIFHHIPKDGNSPRGHGVLNGDADVVMLIEGAAGQPRTVRFTKNRNGASDLTFAFAIRSENLGTDEDGDPITAAIAQEIEPATADNSRAREAKLRDQPAILLRESRSAIAEFGEPVEPDPGMPMVRAVPRATLRKRLILRGWFPEDVLQTAPKSEPKLMRAGYRIENHALTALKRTNFLAFNRNWVWLL